MQKAMQKANARSKSCDPRGYRDLLVVMLRNIAPYARGMRRFSVTDREIDGFTAEVVAAAVSGELLRAARVLRYLQRGEEVYNRSKTLYQWACEAYGRPPKEMAAQTPLACPPDGVVSLAAQVSNDRLVALEARGTVSWDNLCLQKLGAYAAMVVSAVNLDLSEYDPYELIHKTLCSLSGELSVFELAALAQLLEKETLRLVNYLVAGDTLVDLPATRTSVRTVQIVNVDSVPAPRGGVTEDRV